MTEETDAERAARKSREWKAHQAEMAEAAREDAELSRKRRAAHDRQRQENYQESGQRNLIVMAVGAVIILLALERISIGNRADDCLEGAKRPHQYNCAVTLTKSFWSWLIPSDSAALLRASAASNR